MATKTIGSAVGRDYANVVDWFAGIPATVLENEVGALYNDSENVLTAVVIFSGKTPGAFSISLSPAAGQGFADSKNNPGFKLSYVASQGVAFSSATGYMSPLFTLNQAKMSITGIQIKTTAANSGCIEHINANSSTSYLKNIIADSNGAAGGSRYPIRLSGGKAINCLAIVRNGSTNAIPTEYGAVVLNCTAVVVAGSSTDGITEGGGTNNTVNNSAAFGFTNSFSSGWDASSNYNIAADTTAPGANSLQSKTFANQFVSTTDDFRLKAGSDCIGAGNTDATDAPEDIVGTTRGTTTSGDIGAWEYVAAAATFIAALPQMVRQAVNRASTY